MSLMSLSTRAFERLPLPDGISRAVIAALVSHTDRGCAATAPDAGRFVHEMDAFPIAMHADAANAQHYELPPEFFALMLGARRKYSCCFYPDANTSLDEAEEAALRETGIHAELSDGQSVLELGCGWGSLSLWMAEHYPRSNITAVSNSASQRAHIEAEAERRGLSNLTVITSDMNVFETPDRFDRIVSVEMFEHMANWRALLGRARGWLRPDGLLFLHVFSHRTVPYRFDHENRSDWIAQHFFTGGLMPSHEMIGQFGDLFTLERDWRWSGEHYQRTARDWLARYDANEAAIMPILRGVYGGDDRLWHRRWRLFLLATEGLFGHGGGQSWGVSHYLLRPVQDV